MTRTVLKADTAVLDLEDASDYLWRRSPASALRFLEAAEDTFRRLAGRPGIGTPCDFEDLAVPDLRFFPVSRFKKYVVFYREVADGVEILHVLHGSRDIANILADEFGADDEEGEP